MLRFYVLVTSSQRSYCCRADSYESALQLEPGEHSPWVVCLEDEHTCAVPLELIHIYGIYERLPR